MNNKEKLNNTFAIMIIGILAVFLIGMFVKQETRNILLSIAIGILITGSIAVGRFGREFTKNDQESIKRLVKEHGGSHDAGGILKSASTTLPFKNHELVITKFHQGRYSSEQYYARLITDKPCMHWVTLKNKHLVKDRKDKERILFHDEAFDRQYLVHAEDKRIASKIFTREVRQKLMAVKGTYKLKVTSRSFELRAWYYVGNTKDFAELAMAVLENVWHVDDLA